jgi:flavin-binding protein dodecin
MTARASRYVAGAAAGLALTVSLTGCRADAGAGKASGGDKPAGGTQLTAAQEALAKASEKTADLKSFRATLTTSTVVSGKKTDLTGNLAFRLKPTPAMKLDVPPIKTAGKTMDGFQEVFVGDTIYLKVPALAKQAGKPWVGFSTTDLSKATGIDVQSMQNQGQQANPALNAKMLTASKDVHAVGKETVAGVRTTHYQGTFSLADALNKLDTTERAEAQKIFGQLGLDKLNFNMWVDGQQLPRKLALATAPGSKLALDIAMKYLAFDAPVSIKAPAKSQVADGAKLANKVKDGGSNVSG